LTAEKEKAPTSGALQKGLAVLRSLPHLSVAESEGFEPSMRFWHILP
jgi:hypothetical protein